MRRVLVANRGEIASRVFRTCRRLGVGTAAVFTDPDADAPFVGEADVAVALGADPRAYLDGAAVIDAAQRAGADAIHPGYGFLAENAGFARAVGEAGLLWIGPSPEAIAAMGSKTEARARMQAAGVPVLPEGDAELPVLVKATAGGGGKGMRLVERREDLHDAIAAAQREAAAAFGDDSVFLERYLPRARHVEIQIVGDAHGRVVAFGERDCSVQRRHQKVIEEAPSPAVDAALRERMSAAAVAAGEAIGYVGAGTVEFLLDRDGESFFFLEVNTRLQVEHPVTELVHGVDLVELQLRIAEGEPVPDAPPPSGHAVEARLYAEDPANGFLPAIGTLERFEVEGDVRVDAGVCSGSIVSPHYDPLLAKVISHGATRGEAVARLADALARARVHGTVTNRDFLVTVLRHPEFAAGEADTGFLERHDCTAPLIADRRLAATAHALAAQAARRAGHSLPSGWRNNPSQPQVVAYEGVEVAYRFDRSGRELVRLEVDGEPLQAPRLHGCSATEVDLEVAGVRLRYAVSGGAVNTAEGQVELVQLPRFGDPASAVAAGSLLSPMPGTVLRVSVAEADAVEAGQPLLVLEAMKMEHEVVAPLAGTVTELRVAAGATVQAGAILAVIE